jgi:serine/threonine-protein kinase
VAHALLRWSLLTGYDLPPSLFTTLERIDPAALASMDDPVARSWCNGAAGIAMMYARAFERTGRADYFSRARAAADHAANGSGPGTLCCGLIGRAYAIFAVERVARDPDPRRRDAAVALGVAALDKLAPRSVSLMHGDAGAVHFAIDVLAGGAAIAPVFDG